MSKQTLSLGGLTKRYPQFQLGPLDLTVPQGAFFGLIGPNGSGKTTTLDLILGLRKADGGTVRIFDQELLENEAAIKARLGYVSPELDFRPWGRVKRLFGFMRPFYPDWDDTYLSQLIEKIGLDPGAKISDLSFGGRMSLSLAVALAHHPELLILDEPTAGLDAVVKSQVYEELLGAVGQGSTVIIASHSLSDVERFTDHLGFIHEGGLLLSGATSEVLERYRLVELESERALSGSFDQGLTVRDRQGHRYWVLVDTRSKAYGELDVQGINKTAETALTLEELFIALCQDPPAAQKEPVIEHRSGPEVSE